MSDKSFKMNTQHIYARDHYQSYFTTTPFGPDLGTLAFAKNLAEESERNKLHDAKSLLEAAISKDVVKYIDKTFPSIEKAGELGSHSAVKMAGGAVGKFSKVDDFFKMAQHVEQGHGRELAIEGSGIACAPLGGIAGAKAGAAMGAPAGPYGIAAGTIIGAGVGAFGGSELCKGAMEYATDPRDHQFYTTGKLAPTMTRQQENLWGGQFTEEYVLVNYNWYKPEAVANQTRIINDKVEQVYAYKLVTDDDLTKQLNQTALNATGYPKVIAYLENLAAQSQKIEDKQREMSNQQQFRQSEIANQNNTARNAELGKRMDKIIASKPSNWVPDDGTESRYGRSPNGMPLKESCSQLVVIGGDRFETIHGWAVKNADGSILETQWQLDSQNKLKYHQTDMLDSSGKLQKRVYEVDNQQSVLTFDKHGKHDLHIQYEKTPAGEWKLERITNSKGQEYTQEQLQNFEKQHPHDKTTNTSSLKQAELDAPAQTQTASAPPIAPKVQQCYESICQKLSPQLAALGYDEQRTANIAAAYTQEIMNNSTKVPNFDKVAVNDTGSKIGLVAYGLVNNITSIADLENKPAQQSLEAATAQQQTLAQEHSMKQQQSMSQGGPVHSMGGRSMV